VPSRRCTFEKLGTWPQLAGATTAKTCACRLRRQATAKAYTLRRCIAPHSHETLPLCRSSLVAPHKNGHCADHHPIWIGDERERLVTVSSVMTKSRAPAGGNKYLENGLVKPPRRDTRALSPAGMFGGKAPLRLAAQKSRLRAPSAPMRSAPSYFLCKWGV
jgi:hypothetical protein